MPTTTSPLTHTTHGLRVAASFNILLKCEPVLNLKVINRKLKAQIRQLFRQFKPKKAFHRPHAAKLSAVRTEGFAITADERSKTCFR